MANPTGEVQFIQDASITLAIPLGPGSGKETAGVFGDTNGFGTEQPGNVVDGDFTTDYGSSAVGGNTFVGIDLGLGVSGLAVVNAVPTRAFYAPRYGIDGGVAGGPYWPDVNVQGTIPTTGVTAFPRWEGSLLGVSWTTLTTVNDGKRIVFRGFFNEYLISGASAVRYLRMRTPLNFAETGEQRWYGNYVTNLLCRPCRPVLSPGSGRYSSSQLITLSCPTTNAIIGYTTDGTTPAFDGSGNPTGTTTLYTTGISLPQSTTAETVLKAVAWQNGCSTLASEVQLGTYWSPAVMIVDPNQYTGNVTGYPKLVCDNTWDINGFPVQAHSGSVIWDDATQKYYFAGFYAWLADSSSGAAADCPPRGIWMYSCPDPGPSGVFNWTPVTTADSPPRLGMVLPVSPDALTGTIRDSQTRTRIYINPSPIDPNKKYVMYNHMDKQSTNYNAGFLGVATAPAINGPWTWGTSIQPTIGGAANYRINDLTLVLDPADSNAPWIVSTLGDPGTDTTSPTNNKMVTFLQLDPATDYTTFKLSGGNAITVPVFPGANGIREGLAVFNYNGIWFVIHGKLFGYSDDDAGVRYRASTSAANTKIVSTTWAATNGVLDTTLWASALSSTNDALWNAQPTGILQPIGKIQGSLILLCDKWRHDARGTKLCNSGYCWIPIKPSYFGSATTLAIPKNVFAWDLSFFANTSVVSTSAVLATSLTVSCTTATGGTGPYNYQFQRSPDNGSNLPTGVWTNVGTNSTATTQNDTGLTPSTKYWYRVVITDADFGSDISEPVSVTTSVTPPSGGGGNKTVSLSFPTNPKIVSLSGGGGSLS